MRRHDSTALNLWRHFVVFQNPQLKSLIEQMRTNFGDKYWQVSFVNDFLKSWHRADLIENGAICVSCLERFPFSSKNYICCKKEDCIEESLIENYILYKQSPEMPHVIYRLIKWNESSEKIQTVYIGVTNNPLSRFFAHYEEKDFDYMILERSFSSRKEAEEYELCRIAQERPVLNRAIVEVNSIEHLFDKHREALSELTG